MSLTDIGKLEKHEWDQLLDMISDGKCTPFLGAGVNAGLLPLGSTVARRWAKESDYPLENCDALDQVAEFMGIQSDDRSAPKRRFVKLLRSELAQIDPAQIETFLRSPDQPLGVLAGLPLPVYITTNYDNLLMRALQAQGKAGRRELCHWYEQPKAAGVAPAGVADADDAYTPDKDHPLVFHMHGHEEVPDSLVLSEDDYLDFLVSITRGRVLPPLVEAALTSTTLLFIGYRLADINFRVIFRGLVGAVDPRLRRPSVSVQLPPEASTQNADRVQAYLGQYLLKDKVHVFWGTADEFAKQLGERWKQYAGLS